MSVHSQFPFENLSLIQSLPCQKHFSVVFLLQVPDELCRSDFVGFRSEDIYSLDGFFSCDSFSKFLFMKDTLLSLEYFFLPGTKLSRALNAHL